MPASLLDSRLRSVNVNPQLCDRSSPSHGVQLQSLGEFAVTGSWAGRLHHHPQNKRPVLVQIMVLQRLAACGSSAPVTLWWEPHLWLVMGEMKMDCSVCLSVPSPPQYLPDPPASTSHAEEQQGDLRGVCELRAWAQQ